MQSEIELNRARLEELRATVDRMHIDTERALAEIRLARSQADQSQAETLLARSQQRKADREWKLGPYVMAAGMIAAIAGLTAALNVFVHAAR